MISWMRPTAPSAWFRDENRTEGVPERKDEEEEEQERTR